MKSTSQTMLRVFKYLVEGLINCIAISKGNKQEMKLKWVIMTMALLLEKY